MQEIFCNLTLHKNIVCLLVLVIFFVTPISFQESYSIEESGWNIQHVIGKYPVADPPREDQTFIVYYRALNGTAEWIGGSDYFATNVKSTEPSIFELKIPRNYPYTNDRDYNNEGKNIVVFIDGKEKNVNTYFPSTEDCFFVYSIPFSGSHKIELAFTYYPINYTYHGDTIPESCLKQTIVNDSNVSHDSPIQQLKKGIKNTSIQCRENLVLVIKVSSDLPACVKPETREKLIERGWATLAKLIPQESYISPTVIIPPGVSNSSPQAGLDPDVVVIKLGVNETVYWLNKDQVPLTLTAKDGSWSTGIIKPGETANVKFDHIGLYEYSSKEYPWASGQIVVLGNNVESLDLKEKLKVAQAILSREMGHGSPLVELGFNVDNSLHIGILKKELERIPNASEYYEEKYRSMIPFDVPIRIEFVEQPPPS